jgi:enoyl-CoA hydratase/carnithine racemase
MAEEGPKASVVILRGAGGHAFSAGFDLDELTGGEEDLEADAAIGRAADALSSCPVPVVAQLQGHCHGAAVELALNCDLRVASDDLNLSLRAVMLGVVYRAELMGRMVSTVGLGRTQQLLWGMPALDADEALAWGLVSEVVTSDAIESRVGAIASMLASSPASAVHGTKAILGALAKQSAYPDDVTGAAAWRRAAASSVERKRALAAARTKLHGPSGKNVN